MIPNDLAERLQEAAGICNVLVHMYDEIDYAILHQNIGPALEDFAQFAAIFESHSD